MAGILLHIGDDLRLPGGKDGTSNALIPGNARALEEIGLLANHVAEDQLLGGRIGEQDRPGVRANDFERHVEGVADQLVSVGILEQGVADLARRVQLPFSKEQGLIASPAEWPASLPV